jgi:hypothetical protein
MDNDIANAPSVLLISIMIFLFFTLMGRHVNAMALAVLEDRICNTSEEKSDSFFNNIEQTKVAKVNPRDNPEL